MEVLEMGKYKVIGPMHLCMRNMSGQWNLYLYVRRSGNDRYLVLERGDCSSCKNLLVRVESACLFAHLFNSAWCDCGEQLDRSINMIAEEGKGLLVYALDEDGRGIGLPNHVRAYMMQDKGFDSVAANKELGLRPDMRDFSKCADVVACFNPRSIRLLTNNPVRLKAFKKLGVPVTRLPIRPCVIDEWNVGQIYDKKEQLGHLLDVDADRIWIHNTARQLRKLSLRGKVAWTLVKGGRKIAEGLFDRHKKAKPLLDEIQPSATNGSSLYLVGDVEFLESFLRQSLFDHNNMVVIIGIGHRTDGTKVRSLLRRKQINWRIVKIQLERS